MLVLDPQFIQIFYSMLKRHKQRHVHAEIGVVHFLHRDLSTNGKSLSARLVHALPYSLQLTVHILEPLT